MSYAGPVAVAFQASSEQSHLTSNATPRKPKNPRLKVWETRNHAHVQLRV